MRSTLFFLLFIAGANAAWAQVWHVDLGAGMSYARILPVGRSTKSTENIRYAFNQPGICLGSELYLTLNEHNRVIFSYQLSENKTGIKFRAGKGAGSHDFSYEQFQLHNFSVGYGHLRSIMREKILAGVILKIGIANGIFIGSGYGEAGSGSTSGYVDIRQVTGASIMSSFWIPNASIGINLSPRFQWSPLMERITLSASVTAGLKDIYNDYAKVDYTIYTDKGLDKGTAQYRGKPLLLQLVINYRLFSNGDNSAY